MPTYTYTIKDFAKDAGIKGIHDTRRFIRRYKAQCVWNNQMERIYANKASKLRLFYKACRKAEEEKAT